VKYSVTVHGIYGSKFRYISLCAARILAATSESDYEPTKHILFSDKTCGSSCLVDTKNDMVDITNVIGQAVEAALRKKIREEDLFARS
jgi:hypothetical protein